ncbi:hypothetical protein B0J11DRAFT_433542 [Dendryphion nanum]|uniref:Uncharacterized protein n=1 Tax=Dendryphion nanum TaxID=256645 RepID=A0A9P9DXP5_9PLEO|nr:hypothetical protein B0J11DRAFT_433542 [Dendryphion nanum]
MLGFTASRIQIGAYLFGVALFSISFLVFLNSSVSFVITERIGQKHDVGNAVGTLGFADELVALVACPVWGLLSDRIGVRSVAVLGYTIVGISLWIFVQAKNVYPQLLLARLFFSLGATATATMVTAILPTMTATKARPIIRDPRTPTRGANGASHAMTPSISSELTITPARFQSQSPTRDTRVKNDAGASASHLAGLVGMFTGCGALVALLIFLPLPTRFQSGHSPAAAVADSFYVVGSVALVVAVGCFFGLRNLPGEETKGIKRLSKRHQKRNDDLSPTRAVLSYPRLFLASVKLGFKSRNIGLGYLGGFVARSSSVAISLFIPLFTNTYFLRTGQCDPKTDDPGDIKHTCEKAYKLAAALTGVSQLIALLSAPLFGYLSAKYPKYNIPLLAAAAAGIAGYSAFGSLSSPDPRSEHGSGAVFLIVALLGISQIGAIVCSLALIARGIHNDEMEEGVNSAFESANGTGHPSAGATPPQSPPLTPADEEDAPLLIEQNAPRLTSNTEPKNLNHLKGSIAGTYSLLGGFGILLLTKAGGALFDVTGPSAPFYMMAIFNAILLVVGLGTAQLPTPSCLLATRRVWGTKSWSAERRGRNVSIVAWRRTPFIGPRQTFSTHICPSVRQTCPLRIAPSTTDLDVTISGQMWGLHDFLIIGAGMSGLGLAVQLIRRFGVHNFELIEKSNDVGGTWLANTYPGCGCDVASHFYSYSFALNPNWSRKYSMQPEIQQYFRSVAEQYRIMKHVQFHSIVERAEWNDDSKIWTVTVLDLTTKTRTVRRAKILVSAVGALSVPKKCDTPGAENFKGHLFHSAEWDHSFDWKNKEVVVLGNGCSATQFVPIMAQGDGAVKKITQFSRQAQYLSERENPYYSSTFKAVMKYVPLAMRLYRGYYYWQMESDYPGFDIESGRAIRQELAKENEAYVKRTAPRKYWDALIPKIEIGCKRKVLDTDYLASLHKENVELIYDDPVEKIVEDGVRTKSGKTVHADAIVLAIGFATQQMLFPMEIVGRDGLSLNKYWDTTTQSVAQAYFGTCVPDFPNFFIMMGVRINLNLK